MPIDGQIYLTDANMSLRNLLYQAERGFLNLL
jgi:hypothetical protein